jgi:hypothetical protein
MILFENTTRKTRTSPANLNFRRNLVQSLQPLKRKYPSIIPAPAQTSFSLGLQPHLEHPTSTSSLEASLNPNWLYAPTSAPHSGIFLKLLLTFVSGGLFFSTVLAAIASCYAIGVGNVKRFADIIFVVIQRVWITFTFGLGASKLTLLGGGEGISETKSDGISKHAHWRWKSAWSVLKEKMQETRETAARGVQALRQEAKLYTAAVGAPGLIPLQYMLDRFMPLSLANILEEAIKEALESMPQQKTIKKMTLSSFAVGGATPVLTAARVYDVENVIAFDYDVKWQSELEATVQVHTALASVPVVLKNFSFDGVVRVVLTPLTKTAPGYGAMLLSLPSTPKISLDVRVMGSEIPFLKQEITAALYKSITDEWLWPRRNVIPSMKSGGEQPILSQVELLHLKYTDPLLEAEETLRSQQPPLKSVRDGNDTLSIRVRDDSTKKPMNHVTGLDAAIYFPDDAEEKDGEERNWWQLIVQPFQLSKKSAESSALEETIKMATNDETRQRTSPPKKRVDKKHHNLFQFGWLPHIKAPSNDKTAEKRPSSEEKDLTEHHNPIQFGWLQQFFQQKEPKPAKS